MIEYQVRSKKGRIIATFAIVDWAKDFVVDKQKQDAKLYLEIWEVTKKEIRL